VWLDPPQPAATQHPRAAGVDFKLVTCFGARLQPAARPARLHSLHGRRGRGERTHPTTIAVRPTFNEIVSTGHAPAPDQFFDSVSFGLVAMIETVGGGAAADSLSARDPIRPPPSRRGPSTHI